jgi:hypothetical protein
MLPKIIRQTLKGLGCCCPTTTKNPTEYRNDNPGENPPTNFFAGYFSAVPDIPQEDPQTYLPPWGSPIWRFAGVF